MAVGQTVLAAVAYAIYLVIRRYGRTVLCLP